MHRRDPAPWFAELPAFYYFDDAVGLRVVHRGAGTKGILVGAGYTSIDVQIPTHPTRTLYGERHEDWIPDVEHYAGAAYLLRRTLTVAGELLEPHEQRQVDRLASRVVNPLELALHDRQDVVRLVLAARDRGATFGRERAVSAPIV